MIITKLKKNKQGVSLSLLNDDGATLTMDSEEQPRPEMQTELDGLAAFVVAKCGLEGSDAAESLSVSGFAISKDGKKVLVKCGWPVPGAAGVQNLSTVALPVEVNEDAEEVGAYWGEDFRRQLERCQDEGKKYYRGEREQGQLELEGTRSSPGDCESEPKQPNNTKNDE